MNELHSKFRTQISRPSAEDEHRSREADSVNIDLNSSPLPGDPLIVPREAHSISRRQIDSDALKIMYRLIRYGHRAFLVGGGVRDLLLGKRPKDFDIGTDATPERLRQLFRNSRIIGRRFRIAHVFFAGGKVIEVSTFRALTPPAEDGDVPTLSDDNTYGDPQSDAVRRDLTINGLFYDLSTFSVIDYVGGMRDLHDRIIRVIGEPAVRIREDPVRMIRAIRHSARTGFEIDPKTYQAICENKDLILLCPKARVTEEVVRELRGGSARRSVELLEQTGLLEHLFPFLSTALGAWRDVVSRNLADTLGRIDAQAVTGVEIPSAILYLSLAIGNLIDAVIEELGADPKDPVFQYFWTNPPSAPLEGLPKRKRRRRRRDSPEEELDDTPLPPAQGESLENVIVMLFKPIGASRKDWEAMEILLRLRRQLFTVDPYSLEAGPVLSHPAFRDTLWLMKMTAGDELSNELLESWEDQAEPQRPEWRSERSGGDSRRRRGGQRRGGAGRRRQRG